MLILSAFVLFGSAQAAECQRSRFGFDAYTTEVESKWTMEKDTICDVVMRVGEGVGLREMKIMQRPRHGTAGVQASIAARKFAYQPQRGFVGKDSFVVSAQLTAPTTQTVTSTMAIKVDIDVVPQIGN